MLTRKTFSLGKNFFFYQNKKKYFFSYYIIFLISQPLSESELIDELSEDFDQSKCKEKQSKPTEKTEVCF